MGTNYYIGEQEKCGSCGQAVPGREPLHIGKSSFGWTFLFAPYPEHGLTSYQAWRKFIMETAHPIRDEYGQEFDKDEFFKLVDAKQRRDSEHWSPGETPDAYRTFDAEGYRFSTSADFS